VDDFISGIGVGISGQGHWALSFCCDLIRQEIYFNSKANHALCQHNNNTIDT